MNEKKNVSSRAGIIVAFLPLVSAINPQKCDEQIIPTYPIEPTNPLSKFVIFNSHCAIGKASPTLDVSKNPQPSTNPQIIMRITLNFPNLVFLIATSREYSDTEAAMMFNYSRREMTTNWQLDILSTKL